MDRILHDANNAQRILKLTADTMLLVDRHGVCVDIEPHCDLWFLQENILLGKNIFELLPEYTKERVMPIFQTVLEEQRSISKNFKLVLKDDLLLQSVPHISQWQGSAHFPHTKRLYNPNNGKYSDLYCMPIVLSGQSSG